MRQSYELRARAGVGRTDRTQGDGGEHGFDDGQQHQHLHRCRCATGFGLGAWRDTGGFAIPLHEVQDCQSHTESRLRGAARIEGINLVQIIYKRMIKKQQAMKKVILMMAFAIGMTGAYAQKTVRVEKVKTGTEQAGNGEAEAASPEDETGKSPSTGDLFNGLTRPVTFDRMIPPYALEVTFNKTVHIIFPATIKYVDLGSADILAGKADGSENVLRVKAALRDFSRETNLAVITDDGSYYTFSAPIIGA